MRFPHRISRVALVALIGEPALNSSGDQSRPLLLRVPSMHPLAPCGVIHLSNRESPSSTFSSLPRAMRISIRQADASRIAISLCRVALFPFPSLRLSSRRLRAKSGRR